MLFLEWINKTPEQGIFAEVVKIGEVGAEGEEGEEGQGEPGGNALVKIADA